MSYAYQDETYHDVMQRLIKLAKAHRALPMHFKKYSQNKRNRPVDLTGKRFHRLHVIAIAGRCWRQLKWHCVCDCGRDVYARGYDLRHGVTKSCGCLRNQMSGERAKIGLQRIRQLRMQSCPQQDTHSILNDLMRYLYAMPTNAPLNKTTSTTKDAQ